MNRFKAVWLEGLENARQAPRGKWLAAGVIVAVMLALGAFGFSIG